MFIHLILLKNKQIYVFIVYQNKKPQENLPSNTYLYFKIFVLI